MCRREPPEHSIADDFGPPPVGRDLHERELVDASGGAVPVAVRMVGGSAAQHVHAHAVAGTGAAHAVPAVVGRQQGGDVALGPTMAAHLLDLGPLAVVDGGAVAGLLVGAVQIADQTPAAVVMHAA